MGRGVWGRMDTCMGFHGEGNGTPLQYCCLENPMDGGAWWAAVHGVAKSRTRLSDSTFTFHFPALEKEMATHSSVLAWRIPGTGEPGGLSSLGSHRVGHDWSDLAAWASRVVLVVKNLSANAGDARDIGLIPGWGRFPGGGNGIPLQYFCLKIPWDNLYVWMNPFALHLKLSQHCLLLGFTTIQNKKLKKDT